MNSNVVRCDSFDTTIVVIQNLKHEMYSYFEIPKTRVHMKEPCTSIRNLSSQKNQGQVDVEPVKSIT